MKDDRSNAIEDKIIEAAKQIFVLKGYEATTMADIAAEVGISRSSMHYYFRTKETVFRAIFLKLIGGILPNLEAIISEKTSILEKLPSLIEAYMSALKENPLFPFFMLNEVNRTPQHVIIAIRELQTHVQPIVKLYEQIEDEMRRGLIKTLSLVDLLSVFLGSLVFPLLARNIFTHVFMDGQTEVFNKFLEGRAPFIYDVMYNLLAPRETVLPASEGNA
ncbi:MAG: TetR/AcrR family transcriptional regulator [Tannerellaceae bacterium]|jgi:AcrR family transcriptional regulator|nr:TetR/AcrR family transcriptional regulator [Tannerellaceae bacterium]